mmetsp:Transcript_32510/g.108480  ORF Transcript_32510/g.108480 Transcript_32510/m.108480 type:complete len:212 (-) Transcript_32510:371-1006(-)
MARHRNSPGLLRGVLGEPADGRAAEHREQHVREEEARRQHPHRLQRVVRRGERAAHGKRALLVPDETEPHRKEHHKGDHAAARAQALKGERRRAARRERAGGEEGVPKPMPEQRDGILGDWRQRGLAQLGLVAAEVHQRKHHQRRRGVRVERQRVPLQQCVAVPVADAEAVIQVRRREDAEVTRLVERDRGEEADAETDYEALGNVAGMHS